MVTYPWSMLTMLYHWTCYCNRKHFFIVTVHETIAYFAVTVNLGMQNHNYRAMKLKHINSLLELSCPESTVKIYPMKNMSSRTLPFFKAFKFKSGFVGFYLAYHIANLYLKKKHITFNDIYTDILLIEIKIRNSLKIWYLYNEIADCGKPNLISFLFSPFCNVTLVLMKTIVRVWNM